MAASMADHVDMTAQFSNYCYCCSPWCQTVWNVAAQTLPHSEH